MSGGPKRAGYTTSAKRKTHSALVDTQWKMVSISPSITFGCLRLERERTLLFGDKKTWEEEDKPDWRKEGEETHEATEAFFN